jgi:hypothetical protein
MEEPKSETPVGSILLAIGGVVLAVGSILTWAKASIDLSALAKALGVDPSLLSGAGTETSRSFAGTSIIDGKIVLACGIVAIVVAVAATMRRELWKTLGILAIVAGLVGGGLALWDISTKEDVVSDAKDAAAPSLAAVGIDASVLDDVFDVSLGIGIFLSVAGGIVVLVGGLFLISKPSAMPSMAGMGPAPSAGVLPDSGFTAPGAPPLQPASPAMDTPPPPPPPPEGGTGVDAPGGEGSDPPQA